jgi:hypothetical protein
MDIVQVNTTAIPDLPDSATQAARADRKELVDKRARYMANSSLLKRELISSLGPTITAQISQAKTGTVGLTAKDIVDHVRAHYGKLLPHDFDNLKSRLHAPFDPAATTLQTHVTDMGTTVKELSAAGQEPLKKDVYDALVQGIQHIPDIASIVSSFTYAHKTIEDRTFEGLVEDLEIFYRPFSVIQQASASSESSMLLTAAAAAAAKSDKKITAAKLANNGKHQVIAANGGANNWCATHGWCGHRGSECKRKHAEHDPRASTPNKAYPYGLLLRDDPAHSPTSNKNRKGITAAPMSQAHTAIAYDEDDEAS